MVKQDTRFGELVTAEAKRIYGKDFEFEKCVIRRIGDDAFVVEFELTSTEGMDIVVCKNTEDKRL